jgi:hypothetical protein
MISSDILIKIRDTYVHLEDSEHPVVHYVHHSGFLHSHDTASFPLTRQCSCRLGMILVFSQEIYFPKAKFFRILNGQSPCVKNVGQEEPHVRGCERSLLKRQACGCGIYIRTLHYQYSDGRLRTHTIVSASCYGCLRIGIYRDLRFHALRK